MKKKPITITDKNIKEITGRVNKFFMSKRIMWFYKNSIYLLFIIMRLMKY